MLLNFELSLRNFGKAENVERFLNRTIFKRYAELFSVYLFWRNFLGNFGGIFLELFQTDDENIFVFLNRRDRDF